MDLAEFSKQTIASHLAAAKAGHLAPPEKKTENNKTSDRTVEPQINFLSYAMRLTSARHKAEMKSAAENDSLEKSLGVVCDRVNFTGDDVNTALDDLVPNWTKRVRIHKDRMELEIVAQEPFTQDRQKPVLISKPAALNDLTKLWTQMIHKSPQQSRRILATSVAKIL